MPPSWRGEQGGLGIRSDGGCDPAERRSPAARPRRALPAAVAQGRPVPAAPSCPMTPGRLVLARRRLGAARAPAVGGLDREHRRDGRAQGRLRLRHLGRRADRHPVHDGAGHPGEGSGVVRLRRRERPRPVPDSPDAPDRRRAGLRRRPARARRRPRRLPALGALQRVSAERRSVVDRRVGRDLGPQLERDATARLDIRRRRRDCRSCRASSATTRSRRA